MSSVGSQSAAVVSVIVPVLNDDDALTTLLEALDSQKPDEVIVVDGANNANTREICASCNYLTARHGRGNQLAAGARAATGTVLWFLHADASLQPGGLAAVRRAMGNGAAGGCLRFRFTGERRWYKTCLQWLINLRSAVGIPYGDQGLFFSRSAYEAAGGFSDLPLFEEVLLVKSVRRAGRFIRLREPIGVSPRRWERDGWIRRTLENRLLACGHALGFSPDYLARLYQR
jgi:rSAM/selenodomain-associated transferase 2